MLALKDPPWTDHGGSGQVDQVALADPFYPVGDIDHSLVYLGSGMSVACSSFSINRSKDAKAKATAKRFGPDIAVRSALSNDGAPQSLKELFES